MIQSPFPNIVEFNTYIDTGVRYNVLGEKIDGDTISLKADSPYTSLYWFFNDAGLSALDEWLQTFKGYATKQITEPYSSWLVSYQDAYMNINNEKIVIYEDESQNAPPILEMSIGDWLLLYEAWVDAVKEFMGWNKFMLGLMEQYEENVALAEAKRILFRYKGICHQYFLYLFEPKVLTWLNPILSDLAQYEADRYFINFITEFAQKYAEVEGVTEAAAKAKQIAIDCFSAKKATFAAQLNERIATLVELSRRRPLLAREQYEQKTLKEILAVQTHYEIFKIVNAVSTDAIDPVLSEHLELLLYKKGDLCDR